MPVTQRIVVRRSDGQYLTAAGVKTAKSWTANGSLAAVFRNKLEAVAAHRQAVAAQNANNTEYNRRVAASQALGGLTLQPLLAITLSPASVAGL